MIAEKTAQDFLIKALTIPDMTGLPGDISLYANVNAATFAPGKMYNNSEDDAGDVVLNTRQRLEEAGWEFTKDVRWLLVLLSLYLILAGWMALTNPLFESTDEIRHYRFIRILITEKRLPVQGEEPLRAQSHHPPLYYVLSALASAWVPSPHTGLFDQPLNPHWGYRNWEVGVDNKLQYRHAWSELLNLENLAVYIPRLVNVYLGALTIAVTYGIGQLLWPERRGTALAAASLVAFNPQFIYLSGAINNDILAALAGTVVLYLCLRSVQKGLDAKGAVGLGLAFSAAVLSKIHLAACAPVIFVTVGLAIRQQLGKGQPNQWVVEWLRTMTIVIVITACGAGWWFLRNLHLYGDVTGMSRLNEMWGGRSLENLWALQQGLPYLWSSLWGRFGYGQIPLPTTFYTVMAVVCGFGLLGMMSSKRSMPSGAQLAVVVLSIVIFSAVVSYYVLIQPAGAMGRFLFPVYPVFAVLVAGGWIGMLPRYHKAMAWGPSAGILCFALAALLGYWYPAIRYPATPSGTGIAA
ncbi:MAG: glycosyltransferase family 39 protein, partial [Anaerolineae bacterium]|nr:glycosyltransferase family 39 protein [Anaerolineae bacterium]